VTLKLITHVTFMYLAICRGGGGGGLALGEKSLGHLPVEAQRNEFSLFVDTPFYSVAAHPPHVQQHLADP